MLSQSIFCCIKNAHTFVTTRPPPPPLPKSLPPILLPVGGTNEYCGTKRDDGIEVTGESGSKCVTQSLRDDSRRKNDEKEKESQQEGGRRMEEEKKCITVSGEEGEKVSNSDDHVKSESLQQQEVPVIVPKEESELSKKKSIVWFRPDLTRAAAEQHLLSSPDELPDGSFVIRPGASSSTYPYSLSLLYGGRVYHVNIRKVIENHESSCPSSGSSREMFSLGKGTIAAPGRCFETLQQLVQFYANKPLLLVSSRNSKQEMSQGSDIIDRRKQVKLLLL